MFFKDKMYDDYVARERGVIIIADIRMLLFKTV